MKRSKATATVMIQTTIPHRFLGGEGHGNPSIALKLQHTWGNHHEHRGKDPNWRKTRRGKEPRSVFGEERRGSTKTCPSFPSLLYSSLLFSSSPLSFLDLVTANVDGARMGGSFRVWRGEGAGTVVCYCRAGPSPSTLKNIYNFLIRTPNATCK